MQLIKFAKYRVRSLDQSFLTLWVVEACHNAKKLCGERTNSYQEIGERQPINLFEEIKMNQSARKAATQAIREEILDEIADLTEYAQRGEQPPRCRGYRVRINKERYVFYSPYVTGAEVLEKASLTPPENYTLRVKVAGQRPRKIGPCEKVDLRQLGVEKFKALPRDQREG